MARFLDSPPEMFRFTKLAVEQELGLKGTVKEQYETYHNPADTVGHIKVGDSSMEVAPECVAMLKAILSAGCCLVEERALGCRKAFDNCVLCKTKADFLSKLGTLAQDDIWVNDIYQAAKEEWA